MKTIKVKNNNGFKNELVRHIKMLMGQGVVLGKTYNGVTLSGGECYEGCFTASTYEKGILSLKSDENHLELLVGGDIGSFGQRIYADCVKSVFISV